jgi:hypothetical protein
LHGDVQIGQEGTTDFGLVNVSSFLKVLIKKIEIIQGISKNVLNKWNLQSKKWSINWKGLCVASIQQLSFTPIFFFSTPKQKRNLILIENYDKIEICVGKNILHEQSFEPLTWLWGEDVSRIWRLLFKTKEIIENINKTLSDGSVEE